MPDTRNVIDQLAGNVAPVRPLASPGMRTLAWALAAGLLIAGVASVFGLRDNLSTALAQPPQALEWLGSVLTGIAAAYAAFQVSVPGRSPSWAWLPMLPLVLWLAGLGWGCAADAAQLGAGAFVFQSHVAECGRAIVVMSLPLGLLMVWMVRHAGVVRPGPTALLAALAAAALSSAGVSLFHAGETSLMVLVWHLGAVVLLSLASLAMGRRVFAWVGYAPRRATPGG